MFDLDEKYIRVISISIGAILGSTLRITLIDFFKSNLLGRVSGLFFVNMLSTFTLAYVLALQKLYGDFNHKELAFSFLVIGLISSLSSFSSLILEVLNSIRQKLWLKTIRSSISSIIGGLIFAFLGYQIGIRA